MGLLSQLEKRECSQIGVRSENSVLVQPPEKPAAGDKPALRIAASAEPCQTCGSVLAWMDVYGGGPHCHRCRPWPSETFIRRLIGYDAVAARWRTIWPLGGPGDQTDEHHASCGHPRTRTRVVWPGTERLDRRTGQAILVPDLDRWQEAEVFEECVVCSWWEESKIQI